MARGKRPDPAPLPPDWWPPELVPEGATAVDLTGEDGQPILMVVDVAVLRQRLEQLGAGLPTPRPSRARKPEGER